jgi:cytochrome c oxidase cbb3-type subunit 3
MRGPILGGFLVVAALATGQEGPGADQRQTSYQKMTPEQRAAATREFLGLGAQPDKQAAARGGPVFQQNCAFCHGPQARGATGPSLITSDVLLGDDHGEHLAPYVKQGRPDKGMPSFADMPDSQLKDIAEFLHLQVEDVANRGAYHVLNIVVGDQARGKAYVAAHCMSCHTPDSFAHIAGKFRSPDQLQRGWIWPSRSSAVSLAVTATVKTTDGATISGRVTQISDFRITLLDADGRKHAIEREPGVEIEIKDPLAPHQQLIMTLANDDMHNVTAWLETLK